ncbi:MAG: hypothetical protein ABSF53_27120 [Terracidiphilus sp.]|jgi:hypothetical protein
MIGSLATPSGGAHHGMGSLSHSELQAAQNALSKIARTSTGLGQSLGSLSQSATLIGGSLRAGASPALSLLHGGSDTFVGGARSTLAASIGTDTIVGGSAKLVDGALGVIGAHNVGSFALNTDTINVAGHTALSVKTEPQSAGNAHTVTVGEKTTITISGLSAHDISKLSH